MPKLAVPSSSHPTSYIRTRLHHPRTRPSRTRCASSDLRPLVHAPLPRNDVPLYPNSSPRSISPRSPSLNSLPLFPHQSAVSFNPKYSVTDDPIPKGESDHQPPDERIIKLGKTLRVLSPLLPTILTNPLPPHILSPSVTLHLFPSTHPHLPTVKGRTLYRAALWAVPVAWSSVPLVGNVKLQILSERIVRAGTVLDGHIGDEGEGGDERLVVRWRTERTPSSSSSAPSKPDAQATPTSTISRESSNTSASTSTTGTNKGLSVLLGGDAPIFKLASDDQFTGLFIFSFDEEGRVLSQTIEHADDATGWERTAKFVTLTDWLIGKARGSLERPPPAPGFCFQSSDGEAGTSSRRELERRYWHGGGEAGMSF
ncbi:hypothetical protein BJX61DRAFT_288750 [Aspergillus egyptiacus]|nr:hypothetical protein BJX61DRAFT_288750 [Aspergillus egyptiacus]